MLAEGTVLAVGGEHTVEYSGLSTAAGTGAVVQSAQKSGTTSGAALALSGNTGSCDDGSF